MKKPLLMLTLALMLSGTVAANAAEVKTAKPLPEERFQTFVSGIEEKQNSKSEKLLAIWNEKTDERETRNENFMTLVTQYSPELQSDFETAFETHNELHNNLFEARNRIRTEFQEETAAMLSELKETLLAQVASQEITSKEAISSLKSFMNERRDGFNALLEEYKNLISSEAEDWESISAEVKTLHKELKAAIKADNTAEISSIITELYDYLLQHISFDQLKLDTLN